MTNVTKKPFGKTQGKENFLYTLKNGKTEVDIMNYGATIVAIRTLGADGKIYDVACGYETLEEYQNNGGYLGAVIGRNSNRIANASFEMNEKLFELYKNDGNNNLHGGKIGFDAKMWEIEEEGGSLFCKYTSPHNECNFPGNVDVTVKYSLSESDELRIDYNAETDQDTLVNLTNHSYFNLNGQDSGNIESHIMKINSNFYTPLDENCCTTGEILSVKGTAFDFNEFKIIGEEINEVPDYKITRGYDHNYILGTNGKLSLIAVTIGDASGIIMKTFTSKPAVQFYAGNFMEKLNGKNGAKYDKRSGFCLETQVTPNCQNFKHLGNAFLKKGEIYNDTTVYQFISHE